jgi:CelD/BcsL family acetyltransferase involved in cellulose biosynthesis
MAAAVAKSPGDARSLACGVPATWRVSRRPVPAIEELAPLWRELQARSNPSFFLSWSWIRCWLQWLPAEFSPELLEVREHDQTLALAIFVPAKLRRARGLIRSRSLHLHATGIERFDELTIEHNGVLAARTFEARATNAMVDYLLASDGQWDELVLDGIDPDYLPQDARTAPAIELVSREVPVHRIDLQAVRVSNGGYLALLGNNTRYQIRASTRRIEQTGPLELRAAGSVDEALAYFEALMHLSSQRWRSRGRKGSFDEPEFVRFHRALIASAFDAGTIQLLCIKAGGLAFGYLYNFVYEGSVLVYQFGIDYQRFEPSVQPGLVAQRLAIEHNATAGHLTYSLLAGDALYKRRLATESQRMYWTVLQRRRWRFSVERWLIQTKRALSRQIDAKPAMPVTDPNLR